MSTSQQPSKKQSEIVDLKSSIMRVVMKQTKPIYLKPTSKSEKSKSAKSIVPCEACGKPATFKVVVDTKSVVCEDCDVVMNPCEWLTCSERCCKHNSAWEMNFKDNTIDIKDDCTGCCTSMIHTTSFSIVKL